MRAPARPMPDAWLALAACRDAPKDIFFPRELSPTFDELVMPMRYCASCPVTAECAAYRRRQDWGVWGGRFHRPPEDYRNRASVTMARVAEFHPEMLVRNALAG